LTEEQLGQDFYDGWNALSGPGKACWIQGALFFSFESYRGRTFWRCLTMKGRRLDLRLYFVRFFKDIVAPIENLKVCYSSS
jgi:hypothetical protein